MEITVSLDKQQLEYLTQILGYEPKQKDIKALIRQSLPDFPQDKQRGGKREGAGRKKNFHEDVS